MWAQPSQKSDSKKNAVIPHTSIIKRLWDYLSILPTVTDLIFFFLNIWMGKEQETRKGWWTGSALGERVCEQI